MRNTQNLPVDDGMNRTMTILRASKYGHSIADLTKKTGLNRNTVSKYLNVLVTLGQAEVQVVGPARVFHLSQRLPVSTSYMNALPASTYIVGTDGKILWANSYFHNEFSTANDEIIGKTIQELNLQIFNSCAELPEYHAAVAGKSKKQGGWIYVTISDIKRRLWISPIVFFDGTPGVLVLIESWGIF